MVLNKLFGKKNQSKEYFFEVKETTPAPASEETVISEKSTAVETTTSSEVESTPVASKSVSKVKSTPVVSKSVDVSYDVPEWVKAIKNYSNQSNGDASGTNSNNFAGTYVTNNVPQSRRRPGPSLSKFKAMASQIGK
ncbi:hypothetical protein [Geminocystis sp. NIES-3709]|uniref:hypothetical protein n=1 Tax=Geminocystis sp. NIES-3709 TaxID=1617448 RepID=UPI0005FC459F|nr:hypothetical protein [Geminocystis sp. NIES-3709]BAQ66824.1 hypothetical protein GM3709_3589 [Geminocystis sp. NIES-3709]